MLFATVLCFLASAFSPPCRYATTVSSSGLAAAAPYIAVGVSAAVGVIAFLCFRRLKKVPRDGEGDPLVDKNQQIDEV